MSISAIAIEKALDCLMLRQAYTAQNIANSGTPDYQSLRVSFEESLKAAAVQGQDAIDNVQAEIVPSGAPGDEVRIDLELATASQTAMRYSSLIEVFGREMAISRAALVWGQ